MNLNFQNQIFSETIQYMIRLNEAQKIIDFMILEKTLLTHRFRDEIFPDRTEPNQSDRFFFGAVRKISMQRKFFDPRKNSV